MEGCGIQYDVECLPSQRLKTMQIQNVPREEARCSLA